MRFISEMLSLLIIWSAVSKLLGLVVPQIEALKWVQQVEPQLDKLLVYLPFTILAVLFLLAFHRIAQLLKK